MNVFLVDLNLPHTKDIRNQPPAQETSKNTQDQKNIRKICPYISTAMTDNIKLQ